MAGAAHFLLIFFEIWTNCGPPISPPCGLTDALGHAACFLQKGRHHLGLVLQLGGAGNGVVSTLALLAEVGAVQAKKNGGRRVWPIVGWPCCLGHHKGHWGGLGPSHSVCHWPEVGATTNVTVICYFTSKWRVRRT